MGRTKKEINWDVVQKKIECGCSAKEIAGGMCEINTFYDRFKEHFGRNFADYADELRSAGPGNIKFTQYMKALSGNIAMLALCGREMCGQGKEPEKISPFEDAMAMRHQNMILQAKIDKLEGNNGDQPQAE